MPRWARIALGLLLLLALLGGGYYGWRAYAYRSQVHQLQQQVATTMGNRDGGRGRGRESFRAVHDQIRSLPEAYQQQFHQGMRDMFMQRMQQRMKDYFELDKAARQKELDQRIAEDEKRRKRWEADRQERAARASAAGTPAVANSGGPTAGNDQRGGPWGGGGGRGINRWLDNTTPEFRALMSEYRREMADRRRVLGLPPSRRPW